LAHRAEKGATGIRPDNMFATGKALMLPIRSQSRHHNQLACAGETGRSYLDDQIPDKYD
jgi:hypothetical protein